MRAVDGKQEINLEWPNRVSVAVVVVGAGGWGWGAKVGGAGWYGRS